MSLPSSPSVAYGAPGNALSSQPLAANATATVVVDFSVNSLGGWIQFWNTGGGTVAANNGLQVTVYPAGDSTPAFDTIAYQGITIPTVVGTPARASIGPLPPAKYQCQLKNLDAANAITVQATSNPVS